MDIMEKNPEKLPPDGEKLNLHPKPPPKKQIILYPNPPQALPPVQRLVGTHIEAPMIISDDDDNAKGVPRPERKPRRKNTETDTDGQYRERVAKRGKKEGANRLYISLASMADANTPEDVGRSTGLQLSSSYNSAIPSAVPYSQNGRGL
jgi:hypothetical protein